MRNNLQRFVAGILVLTTTLSFSGAKPLFNLTPLTSTTFLLGTNEVVNIQYQVSNNTRITRELTMRSIPGITQQTSGSGYCSNPFTLTENQSCILSLSLDSNILPSVVNNGPEICKTQGKGDNTPDNFLCSRPSFKDNLNIAVFPANIPLNIPISANPEILTLEIGGPPVTLSVTNHTITRFSGKNISIRLPSTWSDVTQNANDCAVLAPNQTCNIILTPGNTYHAEETFPVVGDNTEATSVTLSSQSPAVLSESVSALGVSVNNTTLNPALTGTPRKISITNTGTATATNVIYTLSPNLPSGSTITPTSCGNIVPGGVCELTVTPGSNASTSASTLTVSGDNSNTISSTINILTYGSVYQSGYLFSVDDTTPDTGSIGGKITALSNQASSTPGTGILWSATAEGTFDGGVNLYGISFYSTPSDPRPDNADPVAGQTACYGATVGSCNTTNILAYYAPPTTTPAVPAAYYAAGLCTTTISGHSDWFLPAACEMTLCTDTLAIQNIQSNLIENGDLGGFTEGFYWTSTQFTQGEVNEGYVMNYSSSVLKLEHKPKDNLYGVRCVRYIDY